ncbi:hypothetical protein [Desertihabitans aurantiacus]|uniref:hypothetical protein n=1 Tax=Desertihabitans aurantiacus TaxID=2282477 RepID=UPI0013008F21|nr:hypothetical protein [Desertihabitans aurantiacus]
MPNLSNVATSLNMGELTATAMQSAEQRHPGDEYAFYLLKDREVVQRGSYSQSDTVTYQLAEPGTYAVKAFVRNGEEKASRTSQSVTFEEASGESFQETSAALDSTMQTPGLTNTPTELPELRFVQLNYPHQDFAVIVAPGLADGSTTQRLNKVGAEHRLIHSVWTAGQRKLHVMATRTRIDGATDFVFSGMTRNANRFIFGADDLDRQSLPSIEAQVGDFTLLDLTADVARISTDYFGVAKVYYYEDQNITCVANRYHLLLLILRELGVRLELNADKVRASFGAINQMFTQNFSREMDIKGCYVLGVDKEIELREGGLVLQDAPIRNALDARESFDERAYVEMVQAAAEEIKDNLRIALMHPRFSFVRVDVTGGMDARMVIGALSHFRQFEDKIHIHTADNPATPEDLPLSLALLRKSPFQYDSIPRRRRTVSLADSFLDIISVQLGTYYGLQPLATREQLPDTLRINGFYGEVCGRPYYARLRFGRPEEPTVEEFSRKFIASIPDSRKPVVTDSGLAEHFADELRQIAGDTPLEKFDLHYLYYRNGLHCSDKWLNQVLAPGWGPLQSKTMFRLKLATFSEFKSIKVQLDVTDALNIDLARLPYGRDKDNAERAALAPQLLMEGPTPAREDTPEVDDRPFRVAAEARKELIERVVDPRAADVVAANARFADTRGSWISAALQTVLQVDSLFSPRQRMELEQYVEDLFRDRNQKMDIRGVIMINKLLSVCYQLDLARAA